MRILYVEDDVVLAEAVAHLLKKAGIAADHADGGAAGLRLAEQNTYDCVVLDIMLPEMSGIEILEALRRKNITTPVIILSALSEVEDKIKALNLGADDYLAKPFKTAELIARIKAITRRPPALTSKILSFADLKFNPEDRTLNSLALTSKESAIVELLLKNPNRIHSKTAIMNYAWGSDTAPTENYVEVYMGFVRTKLKELKSRTRIQTIRNLGYKIVDEK